MLGLAKMAEMRQQEASQEIQALLAKRSQLLEAAENEAEVSSANIHDTSSGAANFGLASVVLFSVKYAWTVIFAKPDPVNVQNI